VEILLRALAQPRDSNESHDREIYGAAHRLGLLRERAAIPGLLALIDGPTVAGYGGGDTAPTTSTMAVWALIQIGDRSCLPFLRKWTTRSMEDFKKMGGTEALVAYGALAGEEAIPDLTRILKEPALEPKYDFPWRMRVTEKHFGVVKPWEKDTRAVPGFSFAQEAAAFALGRMKAPRGREALLSCLTEKEDRQILTQKLLDTIFETAPRELEAWSQRVLEAPEGEHPWQPNSLRTAALAARLRYFPQKTPALIRPILADKRHPFRSAMVDYLRAQALHDESLTAALVTVLDDPLPPAVKQRREGFRKRMTTIDALGFQGGPMAMATLLELAQPPPKAAGR
jgi:HEAT repeat protein